jgi:hypothetical protein
MKLDWKSASVIAAVLLFGAGIGSLSAQQQATLVRLFLGNAVVGAGNPLPVSATFSPSGTQDVNLKQVGGAAVATGNGTAATSIRVALPTDGTGVVGLNAGSNLVGAVNQQPSSAAAVATTSASSTAAASNLVLKASAGNLYNLTVTIGATSGYLMLFDATSLPVNGAVTPVLCYPIISNGTLGGASLTFNTPKRFGTGITAGFSTTGCFSLTASATGNFFGGYQ